MFVLRKMFSQRGISKHLATHLAQMEKESDGNKVNYVHVEVEAFEMFLHLLVRGDAKMKVIDNFCVKSGWSAAVI